MVRPWCTPHVLHTMGPTFGMPNYVATTAHVQAYLKLNHARFNLTTLKAKLKVSYKLTLLTHVQKPRYEVRQSC
jgi:hypothetical protein